MPEALGLFAFGQPDMGIAPYAELAEPKNNAIDRWLDRVFGRVAGLTPLYRRRLRKSAARVLALQPAFEDMTDQALKEAALALRPRLLSSRTGEPHLSQAFAIVREVSARVLGKRHYPTQIMGALALYDGRLLEMATGEGKTLTATPAAVVAALAGDPVHVVTVNDYLAARDAEENRPIFDFLGLSCGVIDSDMDPDARREAYRSDITYTSNSNLAFDYLRDRIALRDRRGFARLRTMEYLSAHRSGGLMLRGLAFAIVDEADSVFIDEARTPLILSTSGNDPDANAMYETALSLARGLQKDRDFKIDLKDKSIRLEDRGKDRLARHAENLTGLWAITKAREELVSQGLSALHLFALEKDYIIVDGAVQIVDEFTGRVMPDRSWQGGLHQLIEAKEGVEITGRKKTLARITYQRFFRRFVRLSGMTGTGMEVAGEIRDSYGLFTVRLPRHRKLRRRHIRTRFLRTQAKKLDVIGAQVAALHQTGQPVLIGTRSVDMSETVAARLAELGLPHRLLNARQDAEEAAIVAQAGQSGAITVATNIAGRGTDIQLAEEARAAGGLHVILTEFHESNRIDRQLYGRAGRQGDPGSTEAIVALDDEIFRRYAPVLRRVVERFPVSPLCHVLRWRAQARAEAEHATTRRIQAKTDRDMERNLAFTGPPE